MKRLICLALILTFCFGSGCAGPLTQLEVAGVVGGFMALVAIFPPPEREEKVAPVAENQRVAVEKVEEGK